MNEPQIFAYGMPTARVLPSSDTDPNRIGTVGVLQPYSEELGNLLRRHLPELDPANLEHRAKTVTDLTTDTTYNVVTTLVDPADPRANGVVAFAPVDGYAVYLRPAGTVRGSERTVQLGEIGGYQVDPR